MQFPDGFSGIPLSQPHPCLSCRAGKDACNRSRPTTGWFWTWLRVYSINECIEVKPAGTEEPQEAHALAPTGLVNTEEYQVILDPSLSPCRTQQLPTRDITLDVSLSVGIVAGNAIVVEEDKQLTSVLAHPLLVLPGYL